MKGTCLNQLETHPGRQRKPTTRIKLSEAWWSQIVAVYKIEDYKGIAPGIELKVGIYTLPEFESRMKDR